MTTPLQRIRGGAIVLGAILVVALLGYRLAGYDWVGALWMVVVTVSSVGYAERSTLPQSVQLFTIVIIVTGMSAAAYTIGGFIQMTLEGEIERAMGHRRVTRGIERLQNHIIICGFGRIGQELADGLRRQGRKFVVVDHDADAISEAQLAQDLFLTGDATDDDVLLAAGVERAATLVTALPTDASNVFITLTVRNLNPKTMIIARHEHGSSEAKLRQAGADKVVTPAITGARQMERMITRPSTADLMELVAESSVLDAELDEITVPTPSPLIGVSVRETDIQRRHKLLVVAVKQATGNMVFNPGADYSFLAGDTVITMGRASDIEAFRKHYEL